MITRYPKLFTPQRLLWASVWVAIITITLNPSIDRTIKVDDLRRGGVNRAELIRLDAAGKGVNVSRALAAYGIDTHAVMVGAGLGSEWMSEQLAAQDIAHTIVMAQGITRSNLTLVEADGTVTKINEPGVTMTPEILAAIEGALDALPLENNWVVLAGRLNPGAADDTYSRLVQHAKARGARVVLDASGAALQLKLADVLAQPLQVQGSAGDVLTLLDADASVTATAMQFNGQAYQAYDLNRDGQLDLMVQASVQVHMG